MKKKSFKRKSLIEKVLFQLLQKRRKETFLMLQTLMKELLRSFSVQFSMEKVH